MKKFTLLFFLCVILCLESFAQLNPINNLYWIQSYQTPDNYFRLTWSPPSGSNDTLVGYNIYRDMYLYRFQTSTVLNHEETGGNCSVDFLNYNSGFFFIHVTAVYNVSHLESNYIDSVETYGFAIGLEERKILQTVMYPNPTTGMIRFKIKNINSISIYDQKGNSVLKTNENSEIDLSTYPKGVYFIKIATKQEDFIEKIVLE